MTEQRREGPAEPPLSGEIADFSAQFTRTVAENAAHVFRMIGNAAFVAADTISALAEALAGHQPEDRAATPTDGDQPASPEVPPRDIPKAPEPGDIPEVAEPVDIPEAPDRADLPEAPSADIPTVPELADIPEPPPAAEPDNPDGLPVTGWDQLTVGSIRARLGRLGLDQLRTLRAYEQQHAARPVVVTMLDNRIAKVQQQRAD